MRPKVSSRSSSVARTLQQLCTALGVHRRVADTIQHIEFRGAHRVVRGNGDDEQPVESRIGSAGMCSISNTNTQPWPKLGSYCCRLKWFLELQTSGQSRGIGASVLSVLQVLSNCAL